jgi:hypothetical protein
MSWYDDNRDFVQQLVDGVDENARFANGVVLFVAGCVVVVQK